MRIDHIGRACPAEQLTYPLAVVLTQCLDADAGQDPREVGLLSAVAPGLTGHRRTRPEGKPLPLQDMGQIKALA
jgi:hypothetical protein